MVAMVRELAGVSSGDRFHWTGPAPTTDRNDQASIVQGASPQMGSRPAWPPEDLLLVGVPLSQSIGAGFH